MLCHANLRGTVERLRSVKVIVLDWPIATSPNLSRSASSAGSSPLDSSAAGRSCLG